MCAQRRRISLGFSPEEFYEGEHICLIYSDDKERLATMAKFFSSGLEAGERIFYAADTPEAFMDAMTRYGLDSANFEHDFSLAEAYTAFCPDGHFTASHIFDNMANFYQIAVDEGYTGARGGGEMTWASLEDRAEMDKWIELEARRNQSVFAKARLKPGVTIVQAQAVVDRLAESLRQLGSDGWRADNDFTLVATADVIMTPMIDRVIVPAAALMMVVVVLVLLISCANLASFLLAQAADRRKEVAIRLALGAKRRTLIR